MKKVKIMALFSAVATALLLFIFLSSLNNSEDITQADVVTASMNIPSNTEITESMVTVTKFPVDAIHQNAIQDTGLALGKAASSDIVAGEQILNEKLVAPGESNNGSLAYAIEPGMRAITIAVDATTGLSGMLRPQNKIDIIAQFDEQAVSGTTAKSYTTLFLENITILAVDSVLSEDGKAADGSTAAYSTITLQVSPKESMELNMAVSKGLLRTVLRSPLDEKETNLPSITYDQIMVN